MMTRTGGTGLNFEMALKPQDSLTVEKAKMDMNGWRIGGDETRNKKSQ